MSEQIKFFSDSEDQEARSLLDQLLIDSKLYKSKSDYKELLEFVIRLRNFAPFNAMLLQIQKPGLSYAATASDWRERFGRYPKEGSRPLVILWPFGPVAFVYDVTDTEGEELPQDVASFFAQGPIDKEKLLLCKRLLERKNIQWHEYDGGDNNAGAIVVLARLSSPKEAICYRVSVNKNHSPPVQFSTLAHELGHLFLGHLGRDSALNIPDRFKLDYKQREVEAEAVAYLVCCRNGVYCKSESYLAQFEDESPTPLGLNIYQIMRAAGQVENILGLAFHSKIDALKKRS